MFSAAKEIKLWDAQDGGLVTTSGLYVGVFEVFGPDATHAGYGELGACAQILYERLKKDVPDDTLMQFVVEIHDDYTDVWKLYDATTSPLETLQAQRGRRKDFLLNLRPTRMRTFLCLSDMRGMDKKDFPSISKDIHFKRSERLRELKVLVEQVLESAGMTVREASRATILKHFDEALNPDAESLKHENNGHGANPVFQTGAASAGLLGQEMEWNDDWFRTGHSFHQVLTLNGLSEQTGFAGLACARDLPLGSRFIFNVFFPQQAKIQASFRQSRRFAHAAAGGTGPVSDEASLEQMEQSTSLARLIAETGQKLVKFGAQIVLRAATPELVNKRAERTIEMMRSNGFTFCRETLAHDREFFKSLLGMSYRFNRWLLATSNNVADLIPAYRDTMGDKRSVLLMRTAAGGLFSFDPMERVRDNWNAMVLGASGSGKSVFMNMLIATGMLCGETQGRVMVVDFAGETKSSYLMVARLFGGEFFPVVARDEYAINPFPRKSAALNAEGKVRAEVGDFLLVLTDLLLQNTDEGMQSQLYRVILQRAISKTYALNGGGDAPLYSDLLAVLQDFQGDDSIDSVRLKTLIELLGGFLESPASRLFNRQSTISPESNFVIFDLFGIDGLPSNVAEALTFLVCQYVKMLAFDASDSRPKYIVLDEVAQLLKKDAMKSLVDELYSTARKHHTSVWTVTQRYGSYLDSGVSGVINMNSTTKVFLSHGDDSSTRDLIAQDMELSTKEKDLFQSLRTRKGEYSEFLMLTEVDDAQKGKKPIRAKLRLELSPFDYELATSDAADRKTQNDLFKARPQWGWGQVLGFLADRKEEKRL